jgi:uncharacterized membrane protein
MSGSTISAVTKIPVVSNRVTWLDAVRGLAVLGMLETHTVNTLLAPAWKENAVFPWVAYFNGLVAPAFLWIAGYAQGLGWQRRIARGQSGWPVKTIRRLAILWVFAYALHLPWGLTSQSWTSVFASDVLQCLSVSLLLAAVLQKACGRRDWLALAVAAVAIVVAGLWSGNARTGFWPLDAYFDQSGRSLFPLVPWAAFVFLGALMARIEWRPLWLLAIGLAFACTPQPNVFSKTHPAFFSERFGWLMMAVALVIAVEKSVRFPAWLLLAGRESLVIYVAHLTILYALPVQRWIGPTLTPWQTAIAIILLTAASMAVALAVHRWKRRSPSTQVA